MPTVTVHEAKTNLSELLRRVEAGEEIVIARGSRPVAVLRSWDGEEIARKRAADRGSLAGTFPVPPDSVFFDPMSEEELAEWYGDRPDDPLLHPTKAPRPRQRRQRKADKR